MLDLFNGAKYFNQVDLKLRYYYIRIMNEDVEKMVTRTKYDSYKFLVMPFGLCNVLFTFQPS
jgi:translation initiation factor IF-1